MSTVNVCQCGEGIETQSANNNLCHQCQEEQGLVELMRQEVSELPVITPSESNWHAIQFKLKTKDDEKPLGSKPRPNNIRQLIFKAKTITAIAASLSFVMIGFLSWQNYQMEHRFEQVLTMNELLEERLSEQTVPYFSQISISNKLSQLDVEFYRAKTIEEKLAILMQRKKIIEGYLKPDQGVSNEFSI